MKQCNSICAFTGESLNDADAIREANVGFAMGQSGCAVAKDSSSVLILDDNFVSVMNAIKWGRNIFDNVRKFVQF